MKKLIEGRLHIAFEGAAFDEAVLLIETNCRFEVGAVAALDDVQGLVVEEIALYPGQGAGFRVVAKDRCGGLRKSNRI